MAIYNDFKMPMQRDLVTYPSGPYQFVNREFLVITYETDPDVDGGAQACQLIEYYLTNIHVKGAWEGPGALELHSHALAPVAELSVKKVFSALHFVADFTLPYGSVVKDILK